MADFSNEGLMPSLIIFASIIWDLILGEPPPGLHPTVWMGRFISRFWKSCPGNLRAVEFLWGILLVLTGLSLFSILPFVMALTLITSPVILTILAIPLLKVSFSLKFLLQSGQNIRNVMATGNLEEARRLTARHLVSRCTRDLNEKEIASCVIESLSENITDSFTSPLFYFLLAFIPGAWGYRFINTADAMIAYRNEEYEWGGKFTAWCDSLLNYIPARLTALMIVLAAFLVPGASGPGAWDCLISDRKKTESPNAGWTMAAMAGALNVNLEKKDAYSLGHGRPLPHIHTIDICLKLTVLSMVLSTIVLLLIFKGGRQWGLFMAV